MARPNAEAGHLIPCLTVDALILKCVLNQQSIPLDRAFQALADPTRRLLLERLSGGATTVSDLARPIAMSLPAVMQHLAVLEQAGLVATEKIGRVRTCRIQPAAFGAIETWIQARRTEWQQRLDRLENYLEEMKPQGDPNDPAQ
jgi:DNA-binding transcriptional ArsR family regulator